MHGLANNQVLRALLSVLCLCLILVIVTLGLLSTDKGSRASQALPTAPQQRTPSAELAASPGAAMGVPAEGVGRTLPPAIEPGREPESGSERAEAAGAIEASLRVLVRDAEGVPERGVRLVTYSRLDSGQGISLGAPDDRGLPDGRERATTDAEGRAELAPLGPAPWGILVLVSGRLPVFASTSSTEEELVVSLEHCEPLAGWVSVDGSIPDESLELRLVGLPDPTLDWPRRAREVLSREGARGDRLESWSLAGGAFLFEGVPTQERATLQMSKQFRRADGGAPRWTVTAGALDLHLNLTRIPELHLRVLAPHVAAGNADDELSENMTLRLALSLPNGVQRALDVDVQLGGLARAPIPGGVLEAVEVSVVSEGGVLLAHVIDSHPILGPDSPLEIRLNAQRERLAILVSDNAGRALDGAWLKAGGEQFGPSDQVGRLDVELSPAATQLLVGAPGYAAQELRRPLSSAGVLRVSLLPANRLTLLIRSQLADLNELGLGLHLRVENHGSESLGVQLWDAPSAEFSPGASWSVSDLPVDQPVTVELRDRYGYVLESERFTLQAGEQRHEEWTIEAQPRTLSGRVLDPDGRPLPSAAVRYGRSFLLSAQFVEDGRFHLPNVFEPNPVLRFSADGCATRWVRAPGVFVDQDVLLEQGRTLRVDVLGPQGPANVKGLAFWIDEDEIVRARREGPGLYVMENVPLRAGRLVSVDPPRELMVEETSRRVRMSLGSTRH